MLTSIHVLAFQASLSSSSSTLYRRLENLHLPSGEFRRSWSFPNTNTVHGDTTGFSRFQLNGRVVIFWYQRAKNLTCLLRVDQSNWTLCIIPNDFKIRFQVALSRNSRTAFTHSLVITSRPQVLTPSLVVNFGVETTYRQNPRGVLWRYTAGNSGNLKHIVQYVGVADADLWGGGIFFFKFFVTCNVNTPLGL